MEKMLINATQTEEIRVALVKERQLYDLDIECPSEVKKKGNIYKAIVTRREPSLDAVFVEYGAKRQGFLPCKEIAPEYFSKQPDESDQDKPLITSLLRDGQELLVQVDKEERGNKGAALTTYITLAGCYLVLMPNNPKSGGISRRIEGDERDELKETLNALELPNDMGVIIRTAGVGKSHADLQNDLDMLCNQWHAIKHAYQAQLAPCLIHQEGDVVIRSIRDNLRKAIGEIIIDDQISYVKAKQYIEQIKPEFLPNLKLYNSTVPLFNFYQIESQIERAYQRTVPLPSGGALVIDRTEALVSIDINSAKATSGSDIETTAFNTNLEAADEIARQLRLRDLGGLIVIDFIDMSSSKNQREVENRLKEAFKADRARIQVGRISRFGLLEMSRQRLRLSLGESAQEICSHCEGRGTVRSTQSQGLSIIRLIEEETLKEGILEVQVQLSPEMATFIMNEKRDFIMTIEKRHGVSVVIVANPHLQMPQYKFTSLRKEEQRDKHKKPSYALIQPPELTLLQTQETTPADEPVLKTFVRSSASSNLSKGFLKHLWDKVVSAYRKNPEEEPSKSAVQPSRREGQHPHHRRSQGNKRHTGSGNRRGPSHAGSANRNPQTQNNPSRKKQTGTSSTRTSPKTENNHPPRKKLPNE